MKRFLVLLAPAALLVAGCHETAVKPFPMPASFAVQTLSGQHVTPHGMLGSPWVVNFWLPT